MTMLTRVSPDLEVRRSGDGRTVCGILVPYDTATRVDDGDGPYSEAIARSAFDAAVSGDPAKVKFLAHHRRNEDPLGIATLLRHDAAGLYGELYVSKTPAGDAKLELIRDKALDAFSVGFVPEVEEIINGVVYRTKALLLEASIVTFGAYTDALVGAVRSLPSQSPVTLGEGVGESSVEDGSGDPQGLTVVRTGMTPNERERAIAIANLRSFP